MVPHYVQEVPPPVKRFKKAAFIEGSVTCSLKRLKTKMEQCHYFANDRAKQFLSTLLEFVIAIGEGAGEEEEDLELTW